MKYQCTICQRQFSSHKALQTHTGTKDPTSANPHRCSDCGRRFCSDNALQQHLNSPSHASIFRCSTCNQPFRNNHSLQQNQNATAHARNQSTAYQRKAKSAKTAERWKLNPETGLMMDMEQPEDWALCDKDCGWCGHCAESYHY
jgi:uncharacterized Zn-finger protein